MPSRLAAMPEILQEAPESCVRIGRLYGMFQTLTVVPRRPRPRAATTGGCRAQKKFSLPVLCLSFNSCISRGFLGARSYRSIRPEPPLWGEQMRDQLRSLSSVGLSESRDVESVPL